MKKISLNGTREINSLLNSLPFQGKESTRKYGFTLVELIVVITILAILGTIAFISLQGYSKDARDSVRISDISKIKTSLELFQLDAGKYPETTEATNITYSGAIAWTQGIFGIATFNNVTKLDKIPLDPVTDRQYVYSVTNTKQEYQIAGIMEGYEVTINPNPVNASAKTAMLKISGNYNGKVLKVSTGGTDYVLAVPSIITSSGFTVEEIVQNNYLAYNGYKNLPAQYVGSSYDILGDDEINLVNISDLVIYSGDLKKLSSSEQVGIDARKILIENLQKAYSGTTITNVGEIAQIINTDTDDETATEFLSSTIVSNNLGGSVGVNGAGGNEILVKSCDDTTKPINNGHITFTVGTPTSVNQVYVQNATNCGYTCTGGYTGPECDLALGKLISKSTCKLANWIWVEPENDMYIGASKGEGFCISPRFGDWNNDSVLGDGGISWNGWGNLVSDTNNGWNASTVSDTLNSNMDKGQTRRLNSEVSYICSPLGTASSDFETSDTIVGRMQWLATTGNTYLQARSINWITGLVPHTLGTYPQAIPALYIADCIDGVKDLGTTMTYKHKDNSTDTVTYAEYNTNPSSDPDNIGLSDTTYQNRQKYLTAWTQKSGSHLPSAFSYISDGTPGGCDGVDCDFLTLTSRGEYQVACELNKFGTVSYLTNQYIGSTDDTDCEWSVLSAIGNTTGATWASHIRIVGCNGCGDQAVTNSGNHSGTNSARFVIRP